MALSDDQKAMLRLLAQREEGYEDMAKLMGLSVGEVRAKVKEALTEIDEDPEAVEQPAPAPEPPAPPPPPPPPPAAEAPRRPPSPPPPRRKPASPSRPSLPKDRGALLGLGAGLAAVVILVIVLIVGGSGGGGSDSSAASGEASGADRAAAIAESNQKATQAILEPVDGGSASGRALFGRSKEGVLLLLVAKGLDPSPQGKSYTFSLARSPSERVPIAAAKVGANGQIGGQFQIAPESLGLLASGYDELEVSLVSNETLRVALTQATKEKKPPVFASTDVLRGKVTGPIVEAGSQP